MILDTNNSCRFISSGIFVKIGYSFCMFIMNVNPETIYSCFSVLAIPSAKTEGVLNETIQALLASTETLQVHEES